MRLPQNDLATAAVRVYELWLEAQEAQGSPAGSDPTAPGLPRLEYSPWAAEAAPMDEDTPPTMPWPEVVKQNAQLVFFFQIGWVGPGWGNPACH